MAIANVNLNRTVDAAHGDESSRLNLDRDIDELLTVDDVAALLKVSRSWVYEHTRARGTPRSERLPHIKVGKYVRFDPQMIRHFLAKRIKIA
jgi:excisionase family DNA binding protein